MRVSLLSSTLIMAVGFSALVHADGVVNQRRPAPQQQQQQQPDYDYQDPQYQEPQYEEPQQQGYYQDEQPYDRPDVQINNIIIQNEDYIGPVIYPQAPCIACTIQYFGDFARIIAISPNGYGEVVFAGYPHQTAPNRPPELVIAVSDLQARGLCRNLVPLQPSCAPGLVCGGPVVQPPIALPYPRQPGYYPPIRRGRPGVILPGRPYRRR